MTQPRSAFRPHRRRGFTLVELLVVIAIIGVLVALLLPAVQAARESARRTKCINGLKQLAIAMHNYHDTFTSLPVGGAEPATMPRHTWAPGLFPFIEQTAMADRYDQAKGFYEVPNIVQSNTTGVIYNQIPGMFCPSDRGKGYAKMDTYWRSRGNYVVNMGNTRAATDTERSAPFAFNKFLGMKNITDGTSNTLLMAEVLMAAVDEHYDCRGDIYNDDDGYLFTTVNTPNSGVDVCQICTVASLPQTQRKPPPCQTGSGLSGSNAVMVSARSNHPAGIAAAAVDGSVQFVSNNIAIAIWQGLGSANHGETVQFP